MLRLVVDTVGRGEKKEEEREEKNFTCNINEHNLTLLPLFTASPVASMGSFSRLTKGTNGLETISCGCMGDLLGHT